MCGGPCRGLECLRACSCHWLGPGNTNVAVQVGIPGAGRVRYPVYHHPSTLPIPRPVYYPSPHPPVLPSLLHGAVGLARPKEILGVEYAQC